VISFSCADLWLECLSAHLLSYIKQIHDLKQCTPDSPTYAYRLMYTTLQGQFEGTNLPSTNFAFELWRLFHKYNSAPYKKGYSICSIWLELV